MKYPRMKSRRVILRPVNPDDYKLIFKWQSNMENLHMWWADRRVMSYDEFVDDFHRRVKGFFHQMFMYD